MRNYMLAFQVEHDLHVIKRDPALQMWWKEECSVVLGVRGVERKGVGVGVKEGRGRGGGLREKMRLPCVLPNEFQ